MNDAPEADDAALPFATAVTVQDSLMTASHDLDRLQRLLSDACETLMLRFADASTQVQDLLHAEHARNAQTSDALQRLMGDLRVAITALQFQDMASQLITHTHLRLRACVDQIARDAMGDDGEGAAIVAEAPTRPNPVTQDEMDAGSIDLF
jgi:hypothetical protein